MAWIERIFWFVFSLVLLSDGSVAQTVQNTAALKALPSTQYPSVLKLGVNRPGDGGYMFYIASGSPCALNGGTGDDVSQVKSGDNNCWIADPTMAARGQLLSSYGADLTGAVDSTAALQNCLNAAGIGGSCAINYGAKIKILDTTLLLIVKRRFPITRTLARSAFCRRSSSIAPIRSSLAGTVTRSRIV